MISLKAAFRWYLNYKSCTFFCFNSYLPPCTFLIYRLNDQTRLVLAGTIVGLPAITTFGLPAKTVLGVAILSLGTIWPLAPLLLAKKHKEVPVPAAVCRRDEKEVLPG